jgi:hypothetical protein
LITVSATPTAEGILERVAAELDIPPNRHEAAVRRYQDIGTWLQRPESKLAKSNPSVFPQGSFTLGTVIRPLSEDENYDLDLVCESDWKKSAISQSDLKKLVGDELRAYAIENEFIAPTSGQYCWTTNYEEEAQFKLDVLPALPDGEGQRLLMESRGIKSDWVKDAVAITNNRHSQYTVICDDWQTSNPRGFAGWFRRRMGKAFDARRQTLALKEAGGDIAKIPDHRVKTPLQQAVQILKRHRDIYFEEAPELKTTSIVITTLAAHTYGEQSTISGALLAALTGMQQHVEQRNGEPWIPNPTDPRENFADAWCKRPELQASFGDWLSEARASFLNVLSLNDRSAILAAFPPLVGEVLTERVRSRSSSLTHRLPAAIKWLLGAPHKRAPEWPIIKSGKVRIALAQATKDGFRPFRFFSDGPALPKGCSLRFEAETNVEWPYEIYWQIVNSGHEAQEANALRGTFERSLVERGVMRHRENTLYSGVHSIECFIVKNSYCVARSGPFVVNIE